MNNVYSVNKYIQTDQLLIILANLVLVDFVVNNRTDAERVLREVYRGRRTALIKDIRTTFGWSLTEAKNWQEMFSPVDPANQPDALGDAINRSRNAKF